MLAGDVNLSKLTSGNNEDRFGNVYWRHKRPLFTELFLNSVGLLYLATFGTL